MIKENLDDMDYWTKAKDTGVIELVEEAIKLNFTVLKRRTYHLENYMN